MRRAGGFRAAVYALVARIPAGHAMGYGHVAVAIGAPGAARQVGYALAALDPQGQVVPWLRYEQIAGPTTCADAPGQCDADWLDWTTEIPQDDAPTLAPEAFVERLNELPNDASGCALPPLAPTAPTSLTLALAAALYSARRRR